MKYRKPTEPMDYGPVKGDVRVCMKKDVGGYTTFTAVVVSVGEHTMVRRCYREDDRGRRYQIKDVSTTGLDYSMFLDENKQRVSRENVGRRLGRLSKADMRNI